MGPATAARDVVMRLGRITARPLLWWLEPIASSPPRKPPGAAISYFGGGRGDQELSA